MWCTIFTASFVCLLVHATLNLNWPTCTHCLSLNIGAPPIRTCNIWPCTICCSMLLYRKSWEDPYNGKFSRSPIFKVFTIILLIYYPRKLNLRNMHTCAWSYWHACMRSWKLYPWNVAENIYVKLNFPAIQYKDSNLLYKHLPIDGYWNDSLLLELINTFANGLSDFMGKGWLK